MSADAPKRPKRRGLIRWCIGLLLMLPITALLLLNGILATPFVCKRAEAQIHNRTGLVASIDRISVWPWSGISIHHLLLDTPKEFQSHTKEPVLNIDVIQIDPVWQSLLSDKREFKSITLESPRLVLPPELMAAALYSAPPAVGPPLAANTQPTHGPSTPQSPPTNPPVPSSQPRTPQQPTSAPSLPQAPSQPQAPKPATPQASTTQQKTQPTAPTRWLHLKNASLLCESSALQHIRFEIDDASGSIPVAGQASESTITINSASLNQSEILTQATIALKWLSPKLSIEPVEAKLGDLTFQLQSQALLKSSLPLEITAILPQQPLSTIKLPMDVTGIAKSIAGRAHFIGLALSPNTWQADAVIETQSPTITVKGENTAFDHGQAIVQLRSGQLSCIDARLTSDKASLLGNGTILSDGRIAGNLRLVAHPIITQYVVHRFFPGNKKPIVFTPLSTPQRTAFDLEARGNLEHLVITLGHNGPVVETSITNFNNR